MKTKFRKPFTFRLSLYAVISTCWLGMLMHSCILAKSYYRQISPKLNPFYNRHQKSPPFPILRSDTWEPRVRDLDSNPPQVDQYQSILMDKMSSTDTENYKSDLLPQMDPSKDAKYWEKNGDCKQMQKENKDLQNPQKTSGISFRRPSNLNDDKCGLKPIVDGERIVGGKEAEPLGYPWNVALTLKWGLQFCGGSLINKWYVLTAAHCVAWGRSALKMRLRIGDHNLKGKQEDHPHIERGANALKIHIKYDTANTDFDVALIKLDEPVDLTLPNVATVCLPYDESAEYVGRKATVTGWGMTSYSGSTSDFLREVNVTVISNKECSRLYKPNPVTKNMLCAGERKKGGKDACQGDSGGPLVLKKSDERWEQIGVVSWGRECARPQYPGVYTRVTKFYDWIRRHSRY